MVVRGIATAQTGRGHKDEDGSLEVTLARPGGEKKEGVAWAGKVRCSRRMPGESRQLPRYGQRHCSIRLYCLRVDWQRFGRKTGVYLWEGWTGSSPLAARGTSRGFLRRYPQDHVAYGHCGLPRRANDISISQVPGTTRNSFSLFLLSRALGLLPHVGTAIVARTRTFCPLSRPRRLADARRLSKKVGHKPKATRGRVIFCLDVCMLV